MPIAFLRITTLKRDEGRNIINAVAYCQRTELVYKEREDLIFAETLAVENSRYESWTEMWKDCEDLEKRYDARVGREIILAIPAELKEGEKVEAVQKFGRALVERYRCGLAIGIHRPNKEGDQRNYHAHLVMTARRFSEEGKLDKKIRELDLSTTVSQEVQWMHKTVEQIFNAYLAKENQIDFGKYKEDGYVGDRHYGKKIINWERKTGQVHPARTNLTLSQDELSL